MTTPGDTTSEGPGPVVPAEDEGGGVTQHAVEIWTAIVIVALACIVVWDNLRIGAGWGDSGPQAGYFPLRIGIIVGLCGVAIAWHAIRHPSDALFATWTQLKRVSQVLLPLIFYVAAIGFLGIYVASALFIMAFMIFAGRYPWWKSFVIAVATTLLMFFIFELEFKVPLPKGPLEALFGY